ncbi:MAG: hypothetical protein A3K19_24660 [Lentisphaerae bacterium RIFOXYB12_FULL_65_16]|nr:MAG: hypothetical protein A3K18_17300 [Lentisphaerae bacterium RIFOXYA12_64_32]OGV84013.1 MAG: hypothetical protein A3K19_24660 [Lentisphaerae bacterium RIFOXYB12_FULL_65_16]
MSRPIELVLHCFQVLCGVLACLWRDDATLPYFAVWVNGPDGRRRTVGDGVVEIDIIEQQGRLIGDTSSRVDLNVHFTDGAHHQPTVDIDASADFHVWAMQWQEGRIDWYLDSRRIGTYTGPTPQEKMFILIALFQYSGWIGTIDPNLTYPRDFEIDYVRVYARTAK